MKSAFTLLAFALFLTLGMGCCGPLWHPGACGPHGMGGCGSGGCGPVAGCSDGCGMCDGCGELYVDPWINHPADCCDPCDACGNFNGQSCGKCLSVFSGVKSLWGYRCDDSCGCDGGGCSGCDSHAPSDCGCGDGGHSSPIQIHTGSRRSGIYRGGTHQSGETLDVQLAPGETIVESHMTRGETTATGNRGTSRTDANMATARRSSPARQIFQPRKVNEPRTRLAY